MPLTCCVCVRGEPGVGGRRQRNTPRPFGARWCTRVLGARRFASIKFLVPRTRVDLRVSLLRRRVGRAGGSVCVRERKYLGEGGPE